MSDTMQDVQKIVEASSTFHAEMLTRMLEAFDCGTSGWDDPECDFWHGDFEGEILERVHQKIEVGAKDNEADIANYMMMLKYLRQRKGGKT